jgi:hypothetical protein
VHLLKLGQAIHCVEHGGQFRRLAGQIALGKIQQQAKTLAVNDQALTADAYRPLICEPLTATWSGSMRSPPSETLPRTRKLPRGSTEVPPC